MGNSIGGGRKKAKVMKINGETFKLKTPVRACDVLKDYPGYVLLESNSVKQFGIRAKPLEPYQDLMPRKIYFLIELPKFPEEKVTRRARSFAHGSAKERLEGLMLSRRSGSDLSVMRSTSSGSDLRGAKFGRMQVKMRLPKGEVDKLVEESKDGEDLAEKIIHLYTRNFRGMEKLPENEADMGTTTLLHQQVVKRNHGVGGSGIR